MKTKKISDKTKIRNLNRKLAAAVESAANFELDLMTANGKIRVLENNPVASLDAVAAQRIAYLEAQITKAMQTPNTDTRRSTSTFRTRSLRPWSGRRSSS